MAKRILQLNLIREFFDAIAKGEKAEEYRERKEYWTTRLEGREYDIVRFRNGYGPNVPEIDVEWKGVRKIPRKGDQVYAIQLGKVLKREAMEIRPMTAPMRRTDLIKHIRGLPVLAPITESFEPKLRKSGVLNDSRWYETQKEHWLGWLGDYNGPGAYDDLAIREGGTASEEWWKMVAPEAAEAERSTIAANLRAYCQRDTYAMHAIWKKLCDEAGVSAELSIS